jgi:two-component system, OmpR family, sensor kinase
MVDASTPLRPAAARTLPRLRALRRRHSSVRRRVFAALAILVMLAGALLLINRAAVDAAAVMLKRADTSYKELTAYQQLATELLEYAAASSDDAAARARARVETRLAALDALIAFEVEFARDHGGEESDSPEWTRLRRIRDAADRLFAGNEDRLATYRDWAAPLIHEAIAGERSEIALVDRAMAAMQDWMRWVGWLGIGAQLAVLGLVLLLIKRSVLDPLSRLVLDIREFGRGRLAHRVAIRQHDEFGLLARHINRMARHLGSRRRSLEEANATLEAKIAERTRSLEEKHRELLEIDASRRRFLADVSHELRTPLTAIAGEADVTLRLAPATPDGYRDALSAILANAAFLKRRIDDLMALARAADGRLAPRPERLSLAAVAEEAVAEIRGFARVNGITIAAALEPCRVMGDRLRLRQCLAILLDNAIKFSPPAETVTIALARRGREAIVRVSDRGKGVEAAELPLIFERFYQTAEGRRRGGTGLGLAIARRVVEAHGGTIVALRGEGAGMTIAVTLPAAADEAP